MNKKETYELVQNFIKENSTAEKARFDEGLINTSYEIKGMKTKDLELFAKELVEKGAEFSKLPLTCHEEIMLAGLFIGFSKKKASEKIKDIEKLLPYIDNWATCDMILPRLKGLENQKEYFINLLHSNRPFYIRFGIVWLMKYMLKQDIRGIVNLINDNVKNTNYYVEMALAWVYSEALIFDYEYMVDFVQKLERYVVRNRTLQKACESTRVSDERKKEIRALRSELLGMPI